MFAASKTDSVSGGPPDSQFNYVTMLLHGDGTNGAQNNTFVDSSTNNFSITRNGNTTQGSFSPYGSNWSNTFSGGSYLTTPSNTDFTFGTGDFTIELWMNPSSSNQTSTLFSVKGTDYYTDRPILYQYNERVRLFWYSSGNVVTTDYLIVAGKWQHIAVTRSGSDVRIFYNGVLQQTTTNTTSLDSSTVTIGQSLDGNNWPYAGYISNLRVVKGTALYTSNFTPNTTPLTAVSGTSLLTCQGNRFVDVSASPKTITVGTGTPSVQRFNPFGTSTAYSTSVIGGSGYFDGTGDYLSSTLTSKSPGTGSFTYECWFYITVDADNGIFNTRSSDATEDGFDVTVTGFGNIFISYSGTVLLDASVNVKKNQWYHLAIVRNGTTNWVVYLNGISIGTISNNKNFTSTTLLLGCVVPAGTNPLKGYISNFRYTRSAVYTAAFTPPSSPVTSITNTEFIGNFTNGAIFDNAMMNDLETVGNAQISTSVKKYGTGSLAFDGDGDWLKAPNSPNYDMGSGNFTIEGWYYQTADGGQICCKYEPSYQASWAIGFSGSNWDVYTYYSTTSYLTIYTGAAPAKNQWNHFALERNGSNIEFYVNGSRVAQVAAQTLRTSTSAVAVGNLGQGYSSFFTGYIDDLRITKGVARYSGSTYTMPTASFSDTGPI